MKIGILSDTHDNLPQIRKAVDFFNRSKVDFVIHAGDFIAPFAVKVLNRLSADWIGVFGNNDGEKKGLTEKSAGRIKQGPLRLRLGGRRITLVHDIHTLNIAKEKAELIVSGHTHKPEIRKASGKLLVNPGESSGWLSQRPTVALVDLAALEARIIKL